MRKLVILAALGAEWTQGHDFEIGVLSALAVVYQHDAETIAEEIVSACDGAALVRVAQANDDPWLKNLARTVRTVARRSNKADVERRLRPAAQKGDRTCDS